MGEPEKVVSQAPRAQSASSHLLLEKEQLFLRLCLEKVLEMHFKNSLGRVSIEGRDTRPESFFSNCFII